jgi:hypothetical protein
LTLIALALAGAMGMWACGGADPAPAAHRPRDATDAIRQVHLGQTTPRGIEQQFGVADERTADGRLVYRFETTRKRGGRIETEAETVTFRFAGERLSKVCRTRSVDERRTRRAGERRTGQSAPPFPRSWRQSSSSTMRSALASTTR